MSPSAPLPAGSVIGILGGGQLGRMLALAAFRLGMRVHVFCLDPDSPAFEVTPHKTIADYRDEVALARFAEAVDVVTYEFENVPAETALFLARIRPLRPGARALAVAQDRLEEKGFLASIGVPVAPFRPVLGHADLHTAFSDLSTPAVLKTTRLGYDGKGQAVIRSMADAEAAFAALAPRPLVLEAFVPFSREISVVAARGLDGEVRAFAPAENVHRGGILRTSTVPAAISPETAGHAAQITRKILGALDYVGVLGVEFFVLANGELLVNEIAPRVHNSGHWTEAACATDQFEQHMRAITGWPLGETDRFCNVVMENLIGDEVDALLEALGVGARPHLYGKRETRPGRKMGHVNRMASFAFK